MLLIAFALGARDGINYSIFKVPQQMEYLKLKGMLNAWHFCGGVIYLLACLPAIALVNWLLVIPCLLVRVSIYDIAHNLFAKFPAGHLGTEAKSDKLFVKLFGKEGAIKKAVAFILILITLNIVYILT
jgi:hypothetical protein